MSRANDRFRFRQGSERQTGQRDARSGQFKVRGDTLGFGEVLRQPPVVPCQRVHAIQRQTMFPGAEVQTCMCGNTAWKVAAEKIEVVGHQRVRINALRVASTRL